MDESRSTKAHRHEISEHQGQQEDPKSFQKGWREQEIGHIQRIRNQKGINVLNKSTKSKSLCPQIQKENTGLPRILCPNYQSSMKEKQKYINIWKFLKRRKNEKYSNASSLRRVLKDDPYQKEGESQERENSGIREQVIQSAEKTGQYLNLWPSRRQQE